ncbi:MAG: hypothetical protein JOZ81_27910 [Chloroflexi bacterium]|nr:hypothetical protein [Chloroflexota bacterium]MBV9546244.1 hypothetical protein [Chloroflexota bacterium]
MSIATQVAEDFERARRKAFWRRLASGVLRRQNALLAFEETRRNLRAQSQHYGGLRAVRIDEIVGSLGRYADFDRAFLPRQTSTRMRWQSVDRAYYEDTALPPIELYQLGETYFVKDGNHRVSVARERGQEFIDAYIIELHVPVPVTNLSELEDWIRKQDALEFLTRTRLLELRPDANVELTLPGQYEKLLEHIEVHRWFLGTEQERPVAWTEAVESWYDRVYLDTVAAVRESGVLRDFPGRTEADLYLWLIEHRWFMHEAGCTDDLMPMRDVAREFAASYSPRLVRRLGRALRRGADLTRASRRAAPGQRSCAGATHF